MWPSETIPGSRYEDRKQGGRRRARDGSARRRGRRRRAGQGAVAGVQRPDCPGKNPKVRPGSIVYTGDGTGVLAGRGTRSRHPKFGRLHWTASNPTEGRAFGADWVNNCVPFCAAGTFTPYPVNIKVFRPRLLSATGSSPGCR